MEHLNEFTFLAIRAALDAGNEILDVYQSEDFEVQTKQDNSPLTKADLRSNEAIKQYLKDTPFPILSEEEKEVPYTSRKDWERFWLVDPLDGTKEFIKRNGEFTVNIALIEGQYPIMGVIYVPVLKELYFAHAEIGAFKISDPQIKSSGSLEDLTATASQLPMPNERKAFTAVGSRSHMSDETLEYIAELKKQHQEVQMVSKGSSLKLCLVAEGKADVYPRFGPTMEWDTGAGHAIAIFSGASVYQSETKKPLAYNKENLLNPYFIVER